MSNPFTVRKKATVADAATQEASQPSQNFAGERLVGMTFNVPASWHKEFKRRSVDEGITMHDLLKKCYEAYLRESGK